MASRLDAIEQKYRAVARVATYAEDVLDLVAAVRAAQAVTGTWLEPRGVCGPQIDLADALRPLLAEETT